MPRIEEDWMDDYLKPFYDEDDDEDDFYVEPKEDAVLDPDEF